MQRFSYLRAADVYSAARAVQSANAKERPGSETSTQQNAMYVAGGTNVTDYMTLGVLRPSMLVDINRLAAELYWRI
ncbi:MAG TPA: FAD binding domain-containing protein, partial [Steroidobacteraceae bacterium]|nr:FAD binding domain-containing protein [Steroidobacteraceae bacterium]